MHFHRPQYSTVRTDGGVISNRGKDNLRIRCTGTRKDNADDELLVTTVGSSSLLFSPLLILLLSLVTPKSNTVYLQVTLIISIIYLSYIVMQYCTFTNNIVYM